MASAAAPLRQITDHIGASVNIPSISGDGRYVAFDTGADVGGLNPTSVNNVFLLEVPTGNLTLVTNQGGWDPSISADSRWVAFTSSANYVGRNSDESDEIFRWNRGLNRKYQVTRDRLGDGASAHASISGNGKRVAFETNSNLGRRNPDFSDEMYVRRGSNRAVTRDPEGDGGSYTPVISADGEVVAFVSSSNLTGYNSDLSQELFTYNLRKRDKNQVTIDREGNGESWAPAISADGRYVIFMSSSNIGGGNVDNSDALVLLDRRGGKSILNKSSDGSFFAVAMPTISGDGDWIAFISSDNTTGANPDGNGEVVLYSRQRKIFLPVTESEACSNSDPKFSGDGTAITFLSDCDHIGRNPDKNGELFLADNPALALTFHSEGPMWMEVRDPSDNLLSPNLNFIARATYATGDFDADGIGEVKASIPLALDGTYTVRMYAEPGAPLGSAVSVDATLNGLNVTLTSGTVGDLAGVPLSFGNQGFARKRGQVKPLAATGSLARLSARLNHQAPTAGPVKVRWVAGDADVEFDLGRIESFSGAAPGSRIFNGTVGAFTTRMSIAPGARGAAVRFKARHGDLSGFAGANNVAMTMVVQMGLFTDMYQTRFVRQANGNLLLK